MGPLPPPLRQVVRFNYCPRVRPPRQRRVRRSACRRAGPAHVQGLARPALNGKVPPVNECPFAEPMKATRGGAQFPCRQRDRNPGRSKTCRLRSASIVVHHPAEENSSLRYKPHEESALHLRHSAKPLLVSCLSSTRQLVVRLLFGMELGGSGGILGRIARYHSGSHRRPPAGPGEVPRRQFCGWLGFTPCSPLSYMSVGRAGAATLAYLLWPAVLLHAVLTILLGGAWLKQRKNARVMKS